MDIQHFYYRLLAGTALSTFAYNNMSQQQAIAAEGGIRFDVFLEFLQSDDEFFRCNAAFQVSKYGRTTPVKQVKHIFGDLAFCFVGGRKASLLRNASLVPAYSFSPFGGKLSRKTNSKP